jgi:flagellar biosynthesis/type III secretory pathway chaperone
VEKALVQIHEVLQKLVGLHRQLLDATRIERDALAQANLDELQKIIPVKQTIIDSIRSEEALRLKHTQYLAALWKKPIEELTLKSLIIIVQGSDLKAAEQLRSTYNALTVLIQRVMDQNEDNRELIERSMEHVQKMKANVFGGNSSKGNTYNPQGQPQRIPIGSRFLSREV